MSANRNPLKEVEKFPYLGSYLTESGEVETDMEARLGKAGANFRTMNRIWKSRQINVKTKIKLYMAIVVSTALYASDT